MIPQAKRHAVQRLVAERTIHNGVPASLWRSATQAPAAPHRRDQEKLPSRNRSGNWQTSIPNYVYRRITAILRWEGSQVNHKQAHHIWQPEQGCETIHISPSGPWENACIESFIVRFKKECVDCYLFYTLNDTRRIVEDWRQEYNDYRPHSSLGYLPPCAFAAQQSQSTLPDQQEPVRV